MWTALLLSGMLSVAQAPPAAADSTANEPPVAPDRWLLMQSLQGTYPGWLLDGNHIQVYGWTDMSFTASSDAHEQLPMGFNYKANQFLLQQNWLRVDQAVNPAVAEPTLGFRLDTFLGSDYRFTVARGLFDKQLSNAHGEPDTYGIDPIQMYLDLYVPEILKGLDIKLGRFFSQYGVESSDTTQNAVSSHAYTFIYDPFTNTGLLATLKVTDAVTVQSGLVTGSDIVIASGATPTYIGSVKWARPNGHDSAELSVIVGCDRYNTRDAFNNPDIFDLVYTHIFDSRWTYDLETLVGFETNVPDIGTATWFGAVQYLIYTFSPRFNGMARLEFFDDCQGQRTGFVGLYTAATAGVTFEPINAVLLRPEVRYDYSTDSRPFEDKHGVFTATFDVVLRW
jgi:Putative beta-barrel porin-2, OmpL-like. bbp2